MREETMWPPVAMLKRPEKKRATGKRREEEEEVSTILSASPSFVSRFLIQHYWQDIEFLRNLRSHIRLLTTNIRESFNLRISFEVSIFCFTPSNTFFLSPTWGRKAQKKTTIG